MRLKKIAGKEKYKEHYLTNRLMCIAIFILSMAGAAAADSPGTYEYPEECGPGDSMKVDGSVILGTVTDTSEKLEIDGKLKCDGVVIGDWTIRTPDYVFEEDYKLPSIEKVEKYLKENKHLPDVLSAEEMKQNGVDLSELDITLLKKIEELYLYIIEQRKEIEKLRKSVDELNR